MNREDMNSNKTIEEKDIIKALSGLKEVDPPAGLLKDAIADAKRPKTGALYKEKKRRNIPETFKYLGAAAAVVICLGLGAAALSSGILFSGAKSTPTSSAKAAVKTTSTDTAVADNENAKNTASGDLAATATPSGDTAAVTSSPNWEFTGFALHDNRADLMAALSAVPGCGIMTSELSDDIVIYVDNASDISDILKSYVYNITDEKGTPKQIDELSGIITLRVQFE